LKGASPLLNPKEGASPLLNPKEGASPLLNPKGKGLHPFIHP